MSFLGIEEWFSIYFLAKRSGVQQALLRLQEYSGILDCMEGDDAFELEKATVEIHVMTATLIKVAVDTDNAFNGVTDPVVVNLPPVTTYIPVSPGLSAASTSTINISDSISTSATPSTSSSPLPESSLLPEITPEHTSIGNPFIETGST
ncbi:unnamed protein product [Calypogeia fissa]